MESVAEKNGGVRLLVEGTKAFYDTIEAALFDKPTQLNACPECGDTDMFDGIGTCQICQPM